ncbi:MAG: septum formation protein Maf [Oligoflexia bacterium]|nr:septum formation protein Maf [Oligoflexia bacterium]
MKSKTFKLILASRSPRRRQILKEAGFDFTVYPSNSSESFSENLTLEENLRQISKDKIRSTLGRITSRFKKGILVLSADTTVVLGKTVLGKPENRLDAQRMLKFMSGKIHTVYTAYTIYNLDENLEITRLIKTKVGFRKLGSEEIKQYLDSGEAFDKAGSYGIQGLARAFINLVEGDLLNVVGLPLYDIKRELKKRSWRVRRKRD